MTAIEFLSRLRSLGVGVHLDGDRLRIRAPSGVLDDGLRDEIVARRNELISFLGEAAVAGESRTPIPHVPRDEPLPLSFAQQRLWLIHELDRGSAEYNVPVILRVAGEVDLDALERAVAALTSRHESLRTTFEVLDGGPVQVIHPPSYRPLPITDLTGLPAPEAVAEAQRLVSADVERPFDLARGPLLRAHIVRLALDDHILALVLHHIVCDEWSAHLLHSELSTLYEAFRDVRPDPLVPLRIQYADYAVWQRGQLTEQRLHDDLVYWRQALADLSPLELPTDRPRPPVRDPHGGTVQFTVPGKIVAALAQIAHAHGVTQFMTLLAAFQALLARYAGHDDVAVGTPVAGRNHPDTEPLIGFFVNTLVLRTDLSGDPTFTELLDRVRGTTLNAFSHQDLPFEQLVERLAPNRDRSRHPLFQVMFNVEDMTGAHESPLADTCLRPFVVPTTTSARFDLRLILTQEDDGMAGVLEYRKDLFDEETVRQLADRLGQVLETVADDPATPVSSLPMLLPAERSLLASWSAPSGFASVPHLPELICRHAAASGDAVAVSDVARTMTWAEVDQAARHTAGLLRTLGVGPDVVVALAMANTVDLIAAIGGVWYAGGAFLALNPTEPLPRLAHQLAASGAAVVLADDSSVDVLPAGTFTIATIDEATQHATAYHDTLATPDNLAYLVFTSGTTGPAKPVAVSHVNLGHYARAIGERLGVQRGSWLLAQRLSVDLGMTALAAAFATGGRLHVADPDRFRSEAIEQAPDHMKLTPAHLAILLSGPDADRTLPRQTLVVGGEATPDQILTDLVATGWSGHLHNHYGPAETTVGATTSPFLTGSLPLGTPLPGVSCHVLDSIGRPVPIGTPGELCIGGAGVARGYLGAPDLTAHKFVADPIAADGSRLYRSGDRVRWLRDGRLEFLGRLDDQLSLNGYRIEPAEIERELSVHPLITAAAVHVRPDHMGGSRFIAWLTPTVPDDIRPWLAERLPPHLIPHRFVAVDRMPLTTAGKVNRPALPEPEAVRAASAPEPPVGPTERALADHWRALLNVDAVNRTDNFFDLGGHSLLATQLLARIPGDLPLAVLFDHPTLRDLAERVDELAEVGCLPEAVPEVAR